MSIWTATDGSDEMLTPEIELLGDVFIDCTECGGSGEIGTHQDYFGNWETKPCRHCKGYGTEP